MSHIRAPRFNAKARQPAAGSSQRNGKRGATDAQDLVDPNAAVMVPSTKEEKDLKRRERLRKELTSQSNSKMTSKKKKRLDKYIEKKLKKDERLIVMEKLSQLPSIHLQSSSTLGTGKTTTNKERLDRLEDKDVRRAFQSRMGQEAVGVDPGVATTRVPSVVTTSSPQRMAFQSWKNIRRKSSVVAAGNSDTSFDSSDSAYDAVDNNASSDSDEDVEAECSVPERVAGGSDVDGDLSSGETSPPRKRKRVGFKDWALTQLSVAKGYVPPPCPPKSLEVLEQTLRSPPLKKQKLSNSSFSPKMRGPLGADLHLPSTTLAKHLQKEAFLSSDRAAKNGKAVSVTRPPDVEDSRLLLPIVTEEQPIMEAILLNPVVIICGETGSGKTTQVPQFLYEAGFGRPGSENPGMIGITQPRRVAAMSMASRVAHELSLTSSHVSYQIRYDATVSPSTSIKFMTDGVLLRELATDFLLAKYSVIIIDEAHERSINTDILIGVVSRVLKLREEMWKEGRDGVKPLRLVIMSATLRVSDFAENKRLFTSPPPIINVSARQHPVTIHFNRRTPSDYVAEAVKKSSKIHARLPPGGILVFLTGQNEITGVCRKLEAKFGKKALDERRRRRVTERCWDDIHDPDEPLVVPHVEADIEAEDLELGAVEQNDLAFDVDGEPDEDPDALDSDDDGIAEEKPSGTSTDESDVPMHIIPLYSLLPGEKQMRVFEPPPSGSRLVVIATNVAETSLTIPGIRYVIDCGRAKERRYDVVSGIQAFQVQWISKTSAAQRSGRAGRTGPGHCYRLYSSAVFEHHFDAYSQPEILRMPMEGVVLQMKSMHIDAVVNFPFPTPPDRSALKKAESVLTHLGALDVCSIIPEGSYEVLPNGTIGGKVTELGRAMSLFPLSPRFSRMLVGGRQKGCLPYIIAVVSALAVGDPFLHEEAFGGEKPEPSDDEGGELLITNASVKAREAKQARRRAFFQTQKAHASLGNSASDAFKILSVVGAYEYAGGGHQFCAEHFVRPKAMEEIHKLRGQISQIVQANFPAADTGFLANLSPPNALQLKMLRQLLVAGFIDQVVARKDLIQKGSSSGRQFATSRDVPYKAIGISEDVFIHPSSVLFNNPPPDYIAFQELVRTSRVWIKGLSIINAAWLSSLGKASLCSFSKPIKNKQGAMMVIPHFGPEGWELPAVKAD